MSDFDTRLPNASYALHLACFPFECALENIFRFETSKMVLYVLDFRPIGWKY